MDLKVFFGYTALWNQRVLYLIALGTDSLHRKWWFQVKTAKSDDTIWQEIERVSGNVIHICI